MRYCEMCSARRNDSECAMPSGGNRCTGPMGTSDGWATGERPPSITTTTSTSPSGRQFATGLGLMFLLVLMSWGALIVLVWTAWTMMEILLGGR